MCLCSGVVITDVSVSVLVCSGVRGYNRCKCLCSGVVITDVSVSVVVWL